MTTIIGTLTVVITACVGFASCRQAILANRDGTQRGLAILSPIIFIATSVVWAVYGIRIHAWASSLSAMFELILYALVVLVLARNYRVIVGAAAFVAAVFVLSAHLPAPWVGAAGATISVMVWLPQAWTTWAYRNTQLVDAVTYLFTWAIIVGNCLWIAYGAAVHSVAIIIPSVFHVASGILMLICKWKRR